MADQMSGLIIIPAKGQEMEKEQVIAGLSDANPTVSRGGIATMTRLNISESAQLQYQVPIIPSPSLPLRIWIARD